MRVADRTSSRNYLKYLNGAKLAYSKTNEQIASGNRFERLSDDVSAGTRVMRVRMDMYKVQKRLDNVSSVAEEVSMTEDTMTTIQDILTRTHTLSVKAQSENVGESGRTAIANEIKTLQEELLSAANTRYGQKYIFGGTNSSITAPFAADKDGKLTYNGILVDSIQKDDEGFYYMDGAERKSIPMDGNVFMDVGLGITMDGSKVDTNTAYSTSHSGLDILGFGSDGDGQTNNIYNILTELESNIRNYNSDALGKSDNKLSTLSDQFRANLTNIGSKSSFLENMESRLQNTVDNYKKRIYGLMGTDDTEAATTQTMNEYVLKAVLQMGSKVLPVSLMDFLN